MTYNFIPSLRITVPLSLLIFSTILAAGYLYFFLPRADQAIEIRYQQNLYKTLSALQGSLEYFFRKEDLEGVRREVTAIASNPENRSIVVVDENDIVIAANHLEWIGQPMSDVLTDIDIESVRFAQQRLQSTVTLEANKHSVYGYSPINLGATEGFLRPTRTGILFFEKNLTQAKIRSRQQILHQSVYWMGLVGLLAIGLGLLFHQILTRRVDKLLAAVDSLMREDIPVRAVLSGQDELARLSVAIDNMADRIINSKKALQQDIDRRQKIEIFLRESEARMSQILNNSAAVVYVKGIDDTVLFANQHFRTLFKMEHTHILGKKEHEIFPENTLKQIKASDRIVLEHHEAIQFEDDIFVDNYLHSFLVNKFPLTNESEDIYALCSVATDITDRKLAERVLEAAAMAVSEASGDEVFEILVTKLAGVLATDYALIGVLADHDQIETVALWMKGEIVDNIHYDLAGSPCETVVNQTYRCYADQVIKRFPEDHLLETISVSSYAAMPLFDSKGQALGLIAILDQDPLDNPALVESIIRIFAARAAGELERKKFYQALLDSEASYRSLFDSTEDAVFIHDPDDGAILDVNAKACAVYGYTAEEFRTLNVGDISSGEHPFTLEQAARIIQALPEGATRRFEWHRKNKDGSLHWDEVCIKRTVIAGQARVLAFTRDISERKQAEERRLELEAQLRQAQKMEAIGQLTGGIAHDFNNILASVLGNVELSMDIAEPIQNAKLNKYLHNINNSGKRARDLIQQMLTFSRGGRGQRVDLNLAPLINETVKMLKSTLPSSMELLTKLTEQVAMIHSNPVWVEQILMNLYINARDATNGIGKVVISLNHRVLKDALCTGCRKKFSGSFIAMQVSDNGCGIPAEKLDRIFEPFYTTKPVGKGTGMGLAMVHGIIHEQGGHIVVKSESDQGSSFLVLFPVVEKMTASDTLPEIVSPSQMTRFSASILIIDDEEMVADYLAELLQSRGMQVTVLNDSEQALLLFETNPAAFDLIITDQTMPKFTGTELAKRCLRIDPNIPIILYTGHSEDLTAAEVRSFGIKAYLKKPVDSANLLTQIQHLLSA